MSYAEDMGYDAFDGYDFHQDAKDYWDETWVELKSKGYLWFDKNFKPYKPEDISNGHLMAILNFCKRNYRPKEQIDELGRLAKERCLNLYRQDSKQDD